MTDSDRKRVNAILILNIGISSALLLIAFTIILTGWSSFAMLLTWVTISVITQLFENYLLEKYGYRKTFKFDWVNFVKFIGFNLPLFIFAISYGLLIDSTSTVIISGVYNNILLLIVLITSITPLIILSQYGTSCISKMYK